MKKLISLLITGIMIVSGTTMAFAESKMGEMPANSKSQKVLVTLYESDDLRELDDELHAAFEKNQDGFSQKDVDRILGKRFKTKNSYNNEISISLYDNGVEYDLSSGDKLPLEKKTYFDTRANDTTSFNASTNVVASGTGDMGYQKSTWKLSARGSVYLENKKCTVESASLSAVSLAPASKAFIDSYNNDVTVVSWYFCLFT